MPCIFTLPHGFYLLKELANSPRGDALHFLLAQTFPFPPRLLHALHREGLSTPSLTVSKDRCVVPLHHLTDEARNAESVVDVVLRVVLGEDLVKVVPFAAVEAASLIHILFLTSFLVVVHNLHLIFPFDGEL